MPERPSILRIRNFIYKRIPIEEDGNCFFRAIALWVYGDQEEHSNIRNLVVHHVIYHWPRFKHFIIGDESYDEKIKSAKDYYKLMSENGKYGGSQECVAVTEIFNTRLTIYNLDYLTADPYVYGIEYYNNFLLLFSGDRDYGHFDVIVRHEHSVINIDHHL